MADTGIFATTAQVVLKAGVNAHATAILEASINDFMAQAESQINAETEYNWSDQFAVLNTDVRGILTIAASSRAAIMCINYDPNAWTLGTATLKMNVLWNDYDNAIKILKEKDKGAIFVQEA